MTDPQLLQTSRKFNIEINGMFQMVNIFYFFSVQLEFAMSQINKNNNNNKTYHFSLHVERAVRMVLLISLINDSNFDSID